MSSAPAAKLIPGVAAGFVSAYAMFSVLTKDSAVKLPKSVTNPAWAEATEKLLMSAPRVAAAEPVLMNPGRFL